MITKIEGREGHLIDQISFQSSYSTTQHGNCSSTRFGGNGGSYFSFNVQPGDWINEVKIWELDDGAAVAIKFHTMKGKISRKFGGRNPDLPGRLRELSGTCLRSIAARSVTARGDIVLEGLRCEWDWNKVWFMIIYQMM